MELPKNMGKPAIKWQKIMLNKKLIILIRGIRLEKKKTKKNNYTIFFLF